MRKGVAIALAVCIAVLAFTAGAAAGAKWGTFMGYNIVKVLVNGAYVEGDVPAINFEGRTMVPIRFVSDALGVPVQWDEANYTAVIGQGATQPPPTPPPVTPPKQFMNLLELDAYLDKQLATVTMGGQTLHFSVDVAKGSPPMETPIINVVLADGEWPLWQKTDYWAQKSWVESLGPLVYDAIGVRYFIGVSYLGTYSKYPAGFSVDEVTVAGTKYIVAHTMWYNNAGTVSEP